MRYLKIDGTLPIPNEKNKLVENPVLKVIPSLDINDIPLKVIAFASIEDLLQNFNPIVSYEGLSIPHELIIGTKDDKDLIFDRLDFFNKEIGIGNIVPTIQGVIGKEVYLVKQGDIEYYSISYQNIIDTDNTGSDVVDKASLFACYILEEKIKQNYAERFADGRIKSIEIESI